MIAPSTLPHPFEEQARGRAHMWSAAAPRPSGAAYFTPISRVRRRRATIWKLGKKLEAIDKYGRGVSLPRRAPLATGAPRGRALQMGSEAESKDSSNRSFALFNDRQGWERYRPSS